MSLDTSAIATTKTQSIAGVSKAKRLFNTIDPIAEKLCIVGLVFSHIEWHGRLACYLRNAAGTALEV